MHPLWLVLLGSSLLALTLYVCFAGGDAPAARAGAGAGGVAKLSKPAAKAAPDGSNTKIKAERFKLLLEESRARYLRLHPDFVPPKTA